ncbi:15449_t:CDS:2 [Entrophospora sp. SA101]|nr:18974_t:CDS:2 [Entrophospora sp. SA101]CAJ0754019.1 8225_t:CDS:2 [Entrophospora sp. SA101]CAJ0762011.1 15449_t:CDS:2 [Entrophospora sp. SA101]
MNKLFSKTVKNQVNQGQVPSHKSFTEEESTTSTTYSRLNCADTSNRNSQYNLNIFDKDVFTDSLTYHLARASPFSGEVEVLYPFSIPKDNMIIHDNNNDNDNEEIIKTKNEDGKVEDNEPIFYTIYSKSISNSPLYHCVLKQVYNELIIGEAKRISLVGEPIITIRSKAFFLEAELRRTGAFSNTWHFDFEGKDYRWKPAQLGAKDCDLVCELVEYDISPSPNTTTPKFLSFSSSVISPSPKKNKIKIATLSRNSSNSNDSNDRNAIGELTIFKEAWLDVKEHRALEVLLLLGCMVMLDVIETS